MQNRTVSVDRLARELGLKRNNLKVYVNSYRSRLGIPAGIPLMMTEIEAEEIRREVHPKLKLPELEDVEREHGRVHKLNEVAKQLSISKNIAVKYALKLGVAIRIRNGLLPTYVVKDEDVTLIWEAKQCALMRWTEELRARAARASHVSRRRRLQRALENEERDYFGRLMVFRVMRTAVADPELSHEVGPQMETLQYHRTAPSQEPQEEDLDTSAWNKTNFWNHESLDSMTTMQKRRLGLI